MKPSNSFTPQFATIQVNDGRKKESCAPHFSSIEEIGSSAPHFATGEGSRERSPTTACNLHRDRRDKKRDQGKRRRGNIRSKVRVLAGQLKAYRKMFFATSWTSTSLTTAQTADRRPIIVVCRRDSVNLAEAEAAANLNTAKIDKPQAKRNSDAETTSVLSFQSMGKQENTESPS